MKNVFHGYTEKTSVRKSCFDEEFRVGTKLKTHLSFFDENIVKIGKKYIFPSLKRQYKKRVIRTGYIANATKRSCKCLVLL